MNSFHLTHKQWMALRRNLRRQLGITKSKRLTGQDEKLLRIVEHLGGVPEKKRGARLQFWESILREHGADFPKWKSPHTPRRQYKRIKAKLARETNDTEANREGVARAREEARGLARKSKERELRAGEEGRKGVVALAVPYRQETGLRLRPGGKNT